MGADPPNRPRLQRDRSAALLAGVLAGFAHRLAVDPLLIRVGFVVLTVLTGGAALVGYVIAWFVIAEGPEPPARDRGALIRMPIDNARVAAGVGFLTLAVLLLLREAGLWWSDDLSWPLILAAAGATMLWRQTRESTADHTLAPSASPVAENAAAARTRSPGASLYRGGFGVALIAGAALIVLSTSGDVTALGETLITVVVVLIALVLILAPFWWRLGRNLAAERAERIRSQERAELAAHVHDSVLQTLTLMRKRADDPRAVALLARRQERELREWLFQPDARRSGASVAAALRGAADEVEDAHGVAIEVVSVGDAPLRRGADALIAAAREAMTNAAKFAPDARGIAVYAELDADRGEVFVRDRGAGFDPAAVPADRRGVRESIIGRMERAGGKATVRSEAGHGTEVALAVDWRPR